MENNKKNLDFPVRVASLSYWLQVWTEFTFLLSYPQNASQFTSRGYIGVIVLLYICFSGCKCAMCKCRRTRKPLITIKFYCIVLFVGGLVSLVGFLQRVNNGQSGILNRRKIVHCLYLPYAVPLEKQVHQNLDNRHRNFTTITYTKNIFIYT